MGNRRWAIHLKSSVLANHKREQTRQSGEPERGERERVDLGLGLVHCVLVHGKTLYKLFIMSLMGWTWPTISNLEFFQKVESEHISRELKNKLWKRGGHRLAQLEVIPGKLRAIVPVYNRWWSRY